MSSGTFAVLAGLDVVVVVDEVAEDPVNPTSTSISTPPSPPSPPKGSGGIIGGSGFDGRYIGCNRVGLICRLGWGPALVLEAVPAGVDCAVVDEECVVIGIEFDLRRSRSRSSTSC